MKKCTKCGAEFDGNFCPNCGEKWEDEKICPKCGAKLEDGAHFCNECGYSFTISAADSYKKCQDEAKLKVFSALKFVPALLFALFSVLLFAFYATPVVKIVIGEGLPNESIGNVYGYTEIVTILPKLQGTMISLFIFVALPIIFTCVLWIIQLKPNLKYMEIKIGKINLALPLLLECISYIFYIIFLILGTVIITQIFSEGGAEIYTLGACPILLIVFSVFLSLMSASSHIARYLLANTTPELKNVDIDKRQAYLQYEKERKEKYYATHSAPIKPDKGNDAKANKRAAIVYKHAKRRYDKALDGETPPAVIWLDLHKVPIIVGTISLVILIILICVGGPYVFSF